MSIIEVISGAANWTVETGPWQQYADQLTDAVDHVIADPPYDQRTSENMRTMRLGPDERAIEFDGIPSESEVAQFALGTAKRWVVLFCSLRQLGAYASAAGRTHVRDTVWVRSRPMPQLTGDRPAQAADGISILHRPGRKRWNGGGCAAWYYGDTDRELSRELHATPKPVWLIMQLIEEFTDPGDLILDPFGGTGTTGVAALRLGRRAIIIERNPEYAALCRERLAAESQGLSLAAARSGQLSLLGQGHTVAAQPSLFGGTP